MLSPYRVLDLTDEQGMICGQILADLGADVIQVEPPHGSPARFLGPFSGDEPDPERSLYWQAYARNKRSLVLDLDTSHGRDRFLKMARTADFLIESDEPGAMARRGFGYAELQRETPALIYVSISAFGQEGPKAQWAGSDLVAVASGGPLKLYGDEDRPPVRVSVPQGFLHAGAEAAAAALIALHERLRSGRGQHVDVSAQQAVSLATQGDILQDAVGEKPILRAGSGVRTESLCLRSVYPAKDGYVLICHLFGSVFGPVTRRLMEWVYEEGFCDEAMRDKNWVEYAALLANGREPPEEFERIECRIAACTRTRTKAQLLRLGLERDLLIAPCARIDEVVESEQLRARNYFREIRHDPESVSLRYPGPFARFSASPITYRRPAPRLGEHSKEVLDELRAVERVQAELPATPSDEPPLAGINVLDFTWAIAGPGATRMLADYGATVVRIESTRRTDPVRTARPFQDGQPGPETSVLFHTMNAGKRMATLDLTKPLGREVALDLVRWADVVCESFTPGVMHTLGLDYASLTAVKPDVVMLSTCLMGQTGPLARYAGYGNLAAAVVGFFELTGWPDRDPAGPFSAYTDYIAPRFIVAAILAALEYRRRTGRGQYIDLAQAEAALHFLAPAILDYEANGRVPTRRGNLDSELAPHGVYPVLGDDRWVAIAVRDDSQWRALCELLGDPEMASDLRFASAKARLTHSAALDAMVAGFTAKWQADELEFQLQRLGIAASVVRESRELARDPQLLHRGHFVELPHPDGGKTMVEGARSRMSRTPARVIGTAPTLGRDNSYVLEQILGYDAERIADLVIAGVLE